MDSYKAQKYLTFFRMAYFFSASSLLMMVLYINSEQKKLEEEKQNQKRMEAGEPVIRDESEAHAALRKQGTEVGVLYNYSPEKGWHLVEYHRGEYLSKLQKQAFDDAREAQRKALAEGRELPPDAILFVDEPKSS
jgi:hypothetical protein